MLQKFNKDFDAISESIVDPSQIEEEEPEYQQFSPTNSRSRKKEMNGQMNYLRFKDFLVNLGLLSEISSMQAESKERGLLFDMWKILKGE